MTTMGPRNREIFRRIAAGEKPAEVAEAVGLTSMRVQQIFYDAQGVLQRTVDAPSEILRLRDREHWPAELRRAWLAAVRREERRRVPRTD
jgi:hypothetical protein